MNNNKFFTTFFFGLEKAALDELKSQGADIISNVNTSCDFTIDTEKISSILYNSRTLNKIVKVLISSKNCYNYETLYKIVKEYKWEDLFTENQTIKVNYSSTKTNLSHSQYASQKIKDAICDRFRKLKNCRPSVDISNPDIIIEARIIKSKLDIGVNLKNQPLFKRGYREETNAAPMKETLAAGLYNFVKPHNYKKIIDPMCGSGTIIIETAMRLLNIPAINLIPQSYIEKKLNIKKPEYIKSENDYTFIASDKSYNFLKIAKLNINKANLSNHIQTLTQDFFNPKIDMSNSLIIFNAPYGERLHKNSNINEFYKKIGDTMKNYCKNSTIYIFTNYDEHIKNIGLRTSKRTILFNGKIECRLLEYRIY